MSSDILLSPQPIGIISLTFLSITNNNNQNFYNQVKNLKIYAIIRLSSTNIERRGIIINEKDIYKIIPSIFYLNIFSFDSEIIIQFFREDIFQDEYLGYIQIKELNKSKKEIFKISTNNQYLSDFQIQLNFTSKNNENNKNVSDREVNNSYNKLFIQYDLLKQKMNVLKRGYIELEGKYNHLIAQKQLNETKPDKDQSIIQINELKSQNKLIQQDRSLLCEQLVSIKADHDMLLNRLIELSEYKKPSQAFGIPDSPCLDQFNYNNGIIYIFTSYICFTLDNEKQIIIDLNQISSCFKIENGLSFTLVSGESYEFYDINQRDSCYRLILHSATNIGHYIESK